MYKVVVSDLDGTLLNSDQEVSKISKKVIKAIMDKGVKFYIATGRAYPDAKRIMETIGIKIPLISANGAVINDKDGNEVYRNDLTEESRDILLDIDYENISDLIHLNVYTENKWYLLDDNRKHNPFEKKPKYMYEISTIEELKKKSVTKIFYVGPREHLLKLERIILDKTNGKVNVAFTHPECLEIFDIKVNKAEAIKKVGEIEGFNLEDVVAFGDGFNDYEMIKNVGRGYIMKNAHYTLKNALPNNEVITSNSRHGVALKLVELFELDLEEVLGIN